jgi:hypothetical protein
MTTFSNRVIFLNFLKTFLMSFLMIRWMIFSMMMIFQVSIHSIFARMRISFLIAEMNIFELTMIEINDSQFVCFHSIISLTTMLIASLSKISTWARIQWMWISRSQCSILRINVCSRYWSNYFLKYWMTLMTIWQFVNMTMRRFLKWFSITFKAKSSLIISSK